MRSGSSDGSSSGPAPVGRVVTCSDEVAGIVDAISPPRSGNHSPLHYDPHKRWMLELVHGHLSGRIRSRFSWPKLWQELVTVSNSFGEPLTKPSHWTGVKNFMRSNFPTEHDRLCELASGRRR